MYKLKSIARRAALMGTAVALMATGLVPVFTYADALNPLTHRSLTLSSSAPGWDSTDGSGNATYAPPNSGANGQKTGNTFQFNVSTDSSSTNAIKGFTFQYCTGSAGLCTAPGDNTTTGGTSTTSVPTGRLTNAAAQSAHTKLSDLDVVTSSPTEVSSAKFTADYDPAKGNPTADAKMPDRGDTEGNYIVMYKDMVGGVLDTDWSYSDGWAMSASNVETSTNKTGTNNYITLAATGSGAPGLTLHTGGAVKIVFYATDGNYITNPGSGAFFVKINDYNSETTLNSTTLVDGGVTVANVMNQSIEIQTKVLETMDFSVGTVDPDTLDDTDLSTALGVAGSKHTPCDRILQGMTTSSDKNTLQMGNLDQENSLSTTVTYSTHSYWRLSSNSSAGATVYYSGVTLSNTVGDQIDAIHAGDGNSTQPTVGAEQFGLALANGTQAANGLVGGAGHLYAVNYGTEETAGKVYENAADTSTNGIDTVDLPTDVGSNPSYHAPQLYPMIPDTAYDSGAGTVNNNYASGSDPITTKFAFDTNSNLIPTQIATENNQVVDCVTGKMRYIANIAATTPAGIYTTKVNYIAAPQY